MGLWVQLHSVNLALRPVSEDHERSIRSMFESPGFERLLASIEAEYHVEAHRIADGIADLLFSPESQPDRSVVDRCAKLRATLEILSEFTGDSKQFSELTIEQ